MAPPAPSRILRSASYFPVADVAKIGRYYQDVLGFRCEYSAGEPPEFALVVRGAASLMFRVVADPSLIHPNEKQGGTWDVFLWVDDVETMFSELRGNGAEVVYEPTVQHYGMKEFAVRDPNGYVLGFGQEWAAGKP